jgi:hypothetical protein
MWCFFLPSWKNTPPRPVLSDSLNPTILLCSDHVWAQTAQRQSASFMRLVVVNQTQHHQIVGGITAALCMFNDVMDDDGTFFIEVEADTASASRLVNQPKYQVFRQRTALETCSDEMGFVCREDASKL